MEFASAQQPDASIEAVLVGWYTFLDPQPIMNSFRAHLAAATAASLNDRVTQWIHGKRYFREFIAAALIQLLAVPQQSADQILAQLQQRMTLPVDLQGVWTSIGLP